MIFSSCRFGMRYVVFETGQQLGGPLWCLSFYDIKIAEKLNYKIGEGYIGWLTPSTLKLTWMAKIVIFLFLGLSDAEKAF